MADVIGNNDFRGYLNYLAGQGDSQAANAIGSNGQLGYVDNNGAINQDLINQYIHTAQQSPYGSDTVTQLQQAPGYLTSQYANWLNKQVLGADTNTPAQANTGTGLSNSDPTIGQYFDQQQNAIQGQLGRLDTQKGIGTNNILNAYNDAYNKLTGENSTADANTLQNYVQSRADITAGVGQQQNSLQRLLGAHGFGNSSFARDAAPYLAAAQGAKQSNQVGQTYAQNQAALDTNYSNNVNDLKKQRDTQLNGLQSSLDTTKANLLQQLQNIAQQRASVAPGANYASVVKATQPYIDQASALGAQIDQLGATPTYNNNYTLPNLAKYTYSPTQAATISSGPGATSNANQYLTTLLSPLDQEKQKQQSNLVASA